RFEVGTAKDYPEKDFDLVTFFDCLHDMGDPAGAAAHVRQSLKSDGSWMIVEPMAGDRLEDNLNSVGRIYYAASTVGCIVTSLSQEVGAALGAQAGESKLREVITAGGFHHVRPATEKNQQKPRTLLDTKSPIQVRNLVSSSGESTRTCHTLLGRGYRIIKSIESDILLDGNHATRKAGLAV